MARQKPIELRFEGNPLIAVKLTEREGQLPLREVLISNGSTVRVLATAEPDYPGVYTVQIHAAKGARGIIIRATTGLELSGLLDGTTALISADAVTGDLTVVHR